MLIGAREQSCTRQVLSEIKTKLTPRNLSGKYATGNSTIRLVRERTGEIRTENIRLAPATRSPRKSSLLMTALLFSLTALTFTTYDAALQGQLVADDFSLVGQISFRDAIGYFHSSSGFGRNEYRPLTVMSYAVDRWFWGGDPVGFHLTNILLHAITAGGFFFSGSP